MKKTKIVMTITLACLITFILIFPLLEKRLLYPLKYYEYVKESSKEFNIKESLILSVIKAESSFNKNAISKKDAKGLMQLKDSTADFVAKRLNVISYDIFNPKTNIRLGSAYLSYLYSKFNDTKTILIAYNAGEGNVKNWLKDKKFSLDGKKLETSPFLETNAYVKKVEKYAKKYLNYYKNILDKTN